MKANKLLHVLVAIGAGLTGGVEAFGCGGATDTSAARDATADSGSGGYGGIRNDAGYGRISIDSSYGTIMPAPVDAATIDLDAGDASDDGGDAG